MPDNPIARRLITIPAVMALFLAVTALSPLLVLFGATIDLGRVLGRARPAIALRGLAFLWIYLLGQLWALAALLITWPFPRGLKLRATYRLQDRWAGWNLTALQRLFSLELAVTGAEAILPGPIIVLSRHASIVDTLLPARLIARPSGLRLRYVLKSELLADPALDIAGNRLPNVFIDRKSRDTAERASIGALAHDLGPGDGVLIYPEGTRFSASKLRRTRRGPGGGDSTLRRVLPPRPGGTLALLDATGADILVLAHRGLEGLATIREIWHGSLVGSRIDVSMWRVPRSTVPPSRAARLEWLHGLWADLDEWVVSFEPRIDEAPL